MKIFYSQHRRMSSELPKNYAQNIKRLRPATPILAVIKVFVIVVDVVLEILLLRNNFLVAFIRPVALPLL